VGSAMGWAEEHADRPALACGESYLVYRFHETNHMHWIPFSRSHR
jgi:hypothetical protein